MQAAIIVRNRQTDQIHQLFYVPALDEQIVEESVRTLNTRYPQDGFSVDTSQIELARNAARAA